MKIYLHYNESMAESLHQTLKITLPKKWESGPVSNLIDTFVKNYNEKHPVNALETTEVRLETENRDVIPRHVTVAERLNDRQDLYVKVGQPPRPAAAGTSSLAETGVDEDDKVRICRNFGCNKKYTNRTNFDGECCHHTKPPVFHETAKYWSCCPQRKAYDWDSFMEIKGCARGRHSDVKPMGNQFLGGNELRAPSQQPKLKTVEQFNRERGGVADEAPLEVLKRGLLAVGCTERDFEAAKAALMEKFENDEAEVVAEFATEFGFGLHNLIGTTSAGPPPASS